MVRISLTLVVALVLASCYHSNSTLQDFTSGHIGCAPEDIEISDPKGPMGNETWKAECDSRIYFCSSQAGVYSSPTVKCTEKKKKSEE